MNLTQLKTKINTEKKRFELTVDGYMAKVEFIQNKKGVMYLVHTEVPKELVGQGVGNKIVKESLDYLVENNLKLAPLCPFVAAYVKRHAEYQRILAEGFKVS
ncbi:MAG: N-acetyltransferase [Cyclobacteriaceae bacterium]|nr:N-acetyltransferase [Cyclobacteriaceae bacterium HetDA_MAG_MS6]